MSLIRRISASISSTVDRAVSRVENHDAVINAALRDTQQAAARSRVRLARVQKDGHALRTRRTNLELAVSRWTDRAKLSASDDEGKALECLRRKKECEAQIQQLDTSIAQHDEIEARIGEQLKKIERRAGEVARQRNMMRSRQSVAEAMRTVNDVDGLFCSDIEEAFDRWEINLGETEILSGVPATGDALDAAFVADEEVNLLRAELADLMKSDEEQPS